jgi:dihydroorotase
MIKETDILISNGRIEAIGSSLSHHNIDEIIDASGLYILPGMIDDQVHFREPGMTHKADIATESKAAVAGGITSFMDMPNTIPNTLTAERLEEKYQLAAGRSMANYGFYFGASNDNLENIKLLDPRSTCGIKVFMGASTGNMLVDDPNTLENIFKHAPTLVATHCEDTPTIVANEEKMRAHYGEDVPFELHPQIRSTEACVKSSRLAIDLATRFGTRLHILHISTKEEAEAFKSGPITDKQITAEACVHFLHFSSEDYAQKGALIKCNPAIKTPSDREAIITGLLEDRLDLIGTDHAPHSLKEKQNSYFQAPSGLPLVQYALLAVLEHYHAGRFSLPFIAHKTSHAVADCFRISDRGYIREGYWADLVLVDLNNPTQADDQAVLSKCAWTPFNGFLFRSSIYSTIVSGQVAYHQGHIMHPTGQRLIFM